MSTFAPTFLISVTKILVVLVCLIERTRKALLAQCRLEWNPLAVMLGHQVHELLERHVLHESSLSLLSCLSRDDHIAIFVHVECSKDPLMLGNCSCLCPCLSISYGVGAVFMLADAEHLVQTVDRGHL